MATDDECLRVAREYARLAGLTKHRNVRDQLLDLARGWTAIAQHERRSDARVLRFTPATTSRGSQRPSVLHLLERGNAVVIATDSFAVDNAGALAQAGQRIDELS